MSTKIQRAFILVIVTIFIISTIGIGAIYIFDAQNQKKQSDIQAGLIEAQKQLNAQKEQSITPTDQNKENKLEGTQLAGYAPTTNTLPKLSFTDTTVGTGAVVKESDTVTAHYTGAVGSTGKIFQSSYDGGQPIAFPLNGVIAGWTQGVPGMKEGGTRRLFIPATLAYGATPPPGSGIPANADLIFDVTIVKIGE